MNTVYDVIIIGAGPAGLTCGLYCAQAGFKVAVLEKESLGGYIVNLDKVENYPGFAEGVAGAELGQAMASQAMNYGAEIQFGEVQGLEIGPESKEVKTTTGDYSGRVVVVAGGSRPKKLGVPGEEEFIGKGMAYCAMCEGGQFADKVVAVAGGGDAGVTEALYLTKIVSKVIIIEVLPQLNARSLLEKRARENPKIEIICSNRIEAILGDSAVRAVKLLNVKTKAVANLQVDGVLVHIGLDPQTGYLKGAVPLHAQGQILVNDKMETKVPGVLAAGDIRCDSPRQIASAAGDGVIAAISALRYLRGTC